MAGIDTRELLELLRRHRTFVLTTHVNPDGDAIGSQMALARLIREVSGADAEVRIVNRDPTPEVLSFLDPESVIEVYDPARHPAALAGVEVIAALDNSVPARLGEVHDAVAASTALKVCIDHHPDSDPMWDRLFVDEAASCTGQIVHDLFRVHGVEPGPEAATALYTALVSDTGRFRFGNTTEAAFQMAAELVRSGARPAAAYSLLEERMSGAYLKLLGEVLAGAELVDGGSVVVLRVPSELLDRHGMAGMDLGEIINLALRADAARVTVLFKELGPARTKVSLRSKGELDVNRLARRHGGGGHRNASGILLDRPLEEAAGLLVPECVQLAGGTR